jgi:hypothetical protein
MTTCHQEVPTPRYQVRPQGCDCVPPAHAAATWHELCQSLIGLFLKGAIMKRAWLLMLLGIFAFGGLTGMTGCEADFDADDDGGRLEVDVDD